jgi:hypothetical protein
MTLSTITAAAAEWLHKLATLGIEPTHDATGDPWEGIGPEMDDEWNVWPELDK